MKRIILLFALFTTTFFYSQAATDKVDNTLNLSEQIIKAIGYDWYAENFQGTCSIIIEFELDDNQEIIIQNILTDDPEVTTFLERKLRDFHIDPKEKDVSAMLVKLSFSAV